jgi:CDP-diacylglycerol---serine O-phosphatidyltransferase
MPFLVFVYTLAIAFLMVSRLPVFSGKKLGTRVSPDMVLPMFVLVVLFFSLLLSYPWEVLTICTLLYLASLPFGLLSYREHERAEARSAMAAGSAEAAAATNDQLLAPPQGRGSSDDQSDIDRPARLN